MIRVITDHPVALDSLDHRRAHVGGAGTDNSTNPEFNLRLNSFFGGNKVAVLDLGCAGGGFVKTLLDDGHFAVGLEGSDFCKRGKKFEWATIPDNLFTCDVTRSFSVTTDGWMTVFDVVTCWEVMEHFSKEKIPHVVENVLSHLKPEGLWIMSVSPQADPFHFCVHPRGWWAEKFGTYGLAHDEEVWRHFEPHWVRGPNPTKWAKTADNSFHLALRRARP